MSSDRARYLYLDIETIAAQSEEARQAIAKTVRPPATLKKAETIAAWEANEKQKAIDEAVAKTSFDGTYGHVCCIGWAIGEGQIRSASVTRVEDEKLVLEAVFKEMRPVSEGWETPVIVGHNVSGFDIRFLWKRAFILGVRMPAWMPRDPKPWGVDVFDTMTVFAGQRETIGMDRLCAAMGLEGKGDIDGSMVADLWAKGEHETIAEYCRADIERTRAIHRKMMVTLGEAA